MVSLEFAELCLMVTGESDEWTEDDYGALRPPSAAERCTRRLNRTRLYHCAKVSFVISVYSYIDSAE